MILRTTKAASIHWGVKCLDQVLRFALQFVALTLWTFRLPDGSHTSDRSGRLVGQALRERGFQITNKRLSDVIDSYRSLNDSNVVALCKALQIFGCEVNAKKYADLSLLPDSTKTSVLRISVMKSGDIVEIRKNSDNELLVRGSHLVTKRHRIKSFQKLNSGIVVEVKFNHPYKEKGFLEAHISEVWKKTRYVWGVIFLLVVLLFGIFPRLFFIDGALTPSNVLRIGAAALGGLICGLLSRGNFYPDKEMSSLFCAQGPGSSCKSVLGSRYAKILGVPLADIGMIYFLGLLSIHLLHGTLPKIITYITIASALFVPIFIYIQAKLIKRFCSACLIILALVLVVASLGFSELLFKGARTQSVSINCTLLNLLSFVLPGVVWAFFRPSLLLEVQKNRRVKDVNYNSADTFEALTSKYMLIPTHEVGSLAGDIILGLENADIQNGVIVYLSAGCGSCSRVFHEFKQMKEQGLLPGKVALRLKADPLSTDYIDMSVAKYCMAIYETNGLQPTLDALDSWYKNYAPTSLAKWLEKIEPLSIGSLDQAQRNVNEIFESFSGLMLRGTPCLIWNGRPLPDHGSWNELLFLRRGAVSEGS